MRELEHARRIELMDSSDIDIDRILQHITLPAQYFFSSNVILFHNFQYFAI